MIEIKQTEPDTDVAGVKVLCLGRAKPDGSDYRVVDSAGQAVPFRMMWHDAARYTLLAFRAAHPRQPYFVYFGNPDAAAVAEDWQPQCGLIFETRQRPAGANPKTFEEMQALIAGSPAQYGARWQRRIADGFNPFGPSDHYLSLYRGWIRLPKTGQYRFSTASNEASFSFLDGQPLVHWPGRHTEERGSHGEKNVAVELTAGLHAIEYYHEEVTLQQMAFLGWQPPGDGRLWSIPEAVYTAPHEAVAVRYESPQAALPVFEPELVDSVWPENRHTAQYTRYRFATTDPAVRWDFGDGQTAPGARVEHVYLATGNYLVTLSLGEQRVTWPLLVYEIQHVDDQQPAGDLAAYREQVQAYDRTKLDPASLREWTWLMATHAQGEPARAFYETLLGLETEAGFQLEAMARLIELGTFDKVNERLTAAEQIAREAPKSDTLLAAYRQVLIAGGTAHLWQGQTEAARTLYRRAEALNPQVVRPTIRVALTGSYPALVRDYLTAGNPAAAADVLVKWEQLFPTDILTGQTFFWRGNLCAATGQAPAARRYWAKACELVPGAPFETEAKRLLGETKERTP